MFPGAIGIDFANELDAIFAGRFKNTERLLIGLEAVRQIRYRTTRNEDTRCYFCKNNCLRTFIDVDVTGGSTLTAEASPVIEDRAAPPGRTSLKTQQACASIELSLRGGAYKILKTERV